MNKCWLQRDDIFCDYLVDGGSLSPETVNVYFCGSYPCKKETDDLNAKIETLDGNVVTIQKTLKAVALQVKTLAGRL